MTQIDDQLAESSHHMSNNLLKMLLRFRLRDFTRLMYAPQTKSNARVKRIFVILSFQPDILCTGVQRVVGQMFLLSESQPLAPPLQVVVKSSSLDHLVESSVS